MANQINNGISILNYQTYHVFCTLLSEQLCNSKELKSSVIPKKISQSCILFKNLNLDSSGLVMLYLAVTNCVKWASLGIYLLFFFSLLGGIGRNVSPLHFLCNDGWKNMTSHASLTERNFYITVHSVLSVKWKNSYTFFFLTFVAYNLDVMIYV